MNDFIEWASGEMVEESLVGFVITLFLLIFVIVLVVVFLLFLAFCWYIGWYVGVLVTFVLPLSFVSYKYISRNK